MKENIHAGHRARMKERFRKEGLDGFSPHEVLELLLYEYIPRIDTNPLAHRLMERFGSLLGVLQASVDELCGVPGIGKKTAEAIVAMMNTQSVAIGTHFRNAPPLERNDIAFLADWFLAPCPGSMGILLCEHDGRFLRYVALESSQEEDVFSIAKEIARQARARAYFLLVREGDPAFFSEKNIHLLRLLTEQGDACMLDTFGMEAYRPTSILYPRR